MKALTIKQPWGSLIVRGGKDIENRDWHTNYRGIVAVHTSKKLDPDEMESACGMMAGFVPKFSDRIFRQDTFPLGSIIGTVEIVDCVDHSDSPWFCGDFGFLLRNPVAFPEPIECRGALSFWNVPDDLLPRMREQYRLGRAALEAQG